MLVDKVNALSEYSYETHIIIEKQVENAHQEYIALAERHKDIDTMLGQFRQETRHL